MAGKRIDKQTIEDIRFLKSKGFNQHEISAELKISQSTVNKYLRSDDKTEIHPLDNGMVKALARRGWSLENIIIEMEFQTKREVAPEEIKRILAV